MFAILWIKIGLYFARVLPCSQRAICSSLSHDRRGKAVYGKGYNKKRLEDHNDVFADIFNALLFDGEEILCEKYLAPLPTEAFSRSLDGTSRQGSRDVRKADKRHGHFRLICGTENQEGIENTMPQRIMGYDFASYEEQIRHLISDNKKMGKPAFTKRIHDTQKLAPVITVVLYWGDKEWKTPLNLHDLLEFPPEAKEKIKPYVADYPMNLVQVAQLPQAVRNLLKSDFRLLAEYAALKNHPNELRDMILEEKQIIRHPEEFLDALGAVAGDLRYECIREQVRERTQKEAVTMCVIAEEFENRGIEKGIEKGIEVLILDNLEEGKTKSRILDKLVQRFSISRERAEECFIKVDGSK